MRAGDRCRRNPIQRDCPEYVIWVRDILHAGKGPPGYDSGSVGPAGRSGSFQLDHIVPVSECFARKVPEADCASIENLQVVPWLVNVVRNNRFSPETMIGAPVSARRRNTMARITARGL